MAIVWNLLVFYWPTLYKNYPVKHRRKRIHLRNVIYPKSTFGMHSTEVINENISSKAILSMMTGYNLGHFPLIYESSKVNRNNVLFTWHSEGRVEIFIKFKMRGGVGNNVFLEVQKMGWRGQGLFFKLPVPAIAPLNLSSHVLLNGLT